MLTKDYQRVNPTNYPLLFLAGAALFASSIACTLTGQPNQIVVTATPSPAVFAPSPTVTNNVTATSAPTGTPVPTATPAPTATAAPNVALAQADAALRNGDYESAVTTYQSILQRPTNLVDPSLRSSASIGLGTAALREGKFDDAVIALSDFIQTYTSDSRLPQAYFLRGDAYLGISQWELAIADFQVYLQKRPGLIDSYAYERIGDAYLALQKSEEALVAYNKAASAERGLAPMLALREKVAAAYLNVGNTPEAVKQYDAILGIARQPAYRAIIQLAAANVLFNSGTTGEAYARYQDVLSTYPDTLEAYRAMQALLRGGAPIDDLIRGRISFAAEDYNDAITALYAYTGKTPLEKIDPSVFMSLGEAYREVGNYAAANTSFQAIIDQFPTSSLFGEAWLEQGRTLFLNGKVDDAIAKYIELTEKFPNIPQGAEALWRAGYLYSTLGKSEESLATFEILGNKYPGTEWSMDGLFRGGMAAYNAGAKARAQRFFLLLATTGTGDLKAAGNLWLGRLYQIDNQLQLARDAYMQAAQADPGGYYSLRAKDLLEGHGPFVPPAKLDLAFNDAKHIDEAETWLRQKFQITQTGPLWPLAPTLANDPRMVRGTELLTVAAFDEAKGEFRSLRDDSEKNPLAMYQLASFFYRIGLYRDMIETTAKLLDDAKVETLDAPKSIAAMRFPIAYYDLVLPITQRFTVDPLLVFSLMRQESLFEGAATSSAVAQGLMQIIPDTGQYIAMKLNWPNYQNNDVYRPYINVTFGVFYLKEQLDTFNGNVYAALSAYNGGPGNAAEWFRISNGDPDLFIQAISYDETQTYVRRIYEQYEMYSRIYGSK
jgi:soluble lytic murein transglycosylase